MVQHASWRWGFVILVASLASTSGARGQATQATTSFERWGDAQAGICTAVRVEEAVAGKTLRLRGAIRNDSAMPLRLEQAFGWVLVVQSREKAFFSEKLPVKVEEVAAGGTAEITLDLGALKAYPHRKGLKVIGGYPTAAAGEEAPESVGTLAGVLSPGSAKVRWVVYVAHGGEKLMLMSNAAEATVTTPMAEGLSAEARRALVADLLKRFGRDQFAAQQAHHDAVKAGKAIVPELAQAAADPQMPVFGKMWLATAVADIGGEQAGEELAKLLEKSDGAVAHVIAYHGPKVHSANLDQAILQRAQSGKDGVFTAWAARGFSEHGKAYPQGLVDAAVSSAEPRARAEVAAALVKRPEGKNLEALRKLLGDREELVRVAAAKAVGEGKLQQPSIVAAMVAGLDLPGEAARQNLCAALVKITGQPWEYDPEANETARGQVIAQWKAWWAKAAKQ